MQKLTSRSIGTVTIFEELLAFLSFVISSFNELLVSDV